MKNKIILFIILLFLVSFTQIATAGFIEKLIFSNKSYAKHIDTEGYILTNRKIIEILKGKIPSEINLDSYGNIKNAKKQGEEIYLFVRIRNNGNKAAWGELEGKFSSRKATIIINFIHMGSKWNHYIIPLDAMIWPNKEDNKIPNVNFSWNSLYAK